MPFHVAGMRNDFMSGRSHVGYSASKAGVIQLSRSVAGTYAKKGIRVNTVSAGPLRTVAGKGIPGFEALADGWNERAPLRWDMTDPTPVANAIVFLLSEMGAGISGELLHVDGGYHAMGTAIRPPSTT